MATTSNPCANNNGSTSNGNGTTTTFNNGGRFAVPENWVGGGPSQRALKHSVDLSVQWTSGEQSLLEELLVRYAAYSTVQRFAKIAGKLQDKTTRDVALRCKRMSKREICKRRKDDINSLRKHTDKKEKLADGLPYAQLSISMDSDDGISYRDIGGAFGQLLEQNAQALGQISANFLAFKAHENINLFCQTRNNIIAILNNLNDMPQIMKQMPPLPVKLNVELANYILPYSSMPMKS